MFSYSQKVASAVATAALALPILPSAHGSAETPQATQWYFLADRPEVAHEGSYETGSARVNGITYERSVAVYLNDSGYQHGWVEYDLERRCNQLVFDSGIRDDGPADGRASIEVHGDGRVLIKRTSVGFGETLSKNIKLGKVLRLRITSTWEGGRSSLNSVWGNARVNCQTLH
jgi:hypothetical protein